jgi:hypothetical protein
VWRATVDGDGDGGGDGVTLERVGDGWRLADLQAPGDLLVLPTAPGRAIGPGAYLVRIIRRGRAASAPAARTLTPEVAQVAAAIVSACSLTD